MVGISNRWKWVLFMQPKPFSSRCATLLHNIEVDMTTTIQPALSTGLDFLNNPIEPGDEVVFPSPTGELRHGTVTNISPGAIKLLTVQSLIDHSRTTIVLQKNTVKVPITKD